MQEPYVKKGNVAAGIWLATVVALIVIVFNTDLASLEGPPLSIKIVTIMGMVSLWYALWAYTRAKGYSNRMGLFLPLLNVIGMVILLLLKDKHKGPDTRGS